LAAGCSSNSKGPDTSKREVMVFAAASLRESLQELGKTFEKDSGTHVLFNFAGSNELARQIVATPKADLFLSAAENWVDPVAQRGRLAAATRRDLLTNTLVVIAQKGNTWKLGTPCALAELPFKH